MADSTPNIDELKARFAALEERVTDLERMIITLTKAQIADLESRVKEITNPIEIEAIVMDDPTDETLKDA